MVGRTGQERKGSVRQCRARRDRVEQGRTQDFLKEGGRIFFPCIMASRVRKINFTYLSYLPCCRLPQSSHIAKISKKKKTGLKDANRVI